MTPAKLVASLPDSIRVGPFDIGISLLSVGQSLGDGKWGHFNQIGQEIALMAEFPTCPKAVDTFLHEITHAIWWAVGVQDNDGEERTVTALATGWTQVFRDNPWLLDWLKKALK